MGGLTSRNAHHVVMVCHSVNVEQLSKFLAEVLTPDSRRTKRDEHNCITMNSTVQCTKGDEYNCIAMESTQCTTRRTVLTVGFPHVGLFLLHFVSMDEVACSQVGEDTSSTVP